MRAVGHLGRASARHLRGGVRLAVLACLLATPLHAGSMARVAEICSDPMTTGPQKAVVLAADGWARQDKSSLPAVTAIANAHIASFTTGMPDWESRYRAIPQLAGNFIQMIDDGSVVLWIKDDAYLVVSVQQTPEGGEHLGCYFAAPADPGTLDIMARYGPPEEVPDQRLTITRFDETAMVMDPERSYRMFSIFSRHYSYPEFTHPDGYRLERIEQPQLE